MKTTIEEINGVQHTVVWHDERYHKLHDTPNQIFLTWRLKYEGIDKICEEPAVLW